MSGETESRGTRILPSLVPILLFIFVIAYELIHHALVWQEGFNFELAADVIIFGIVGPVAVALSLRAWRHDTAQQAATLADLQRVTEEMARKENELIQLNQELEDIVARRTAHLLQARLALEENNAALQAANEELRELDRLKSEFVSLVSHELRTPLTSIKGGIELVLGYAKDLDPTYREALQITAQETTRLSRLVEDILNVSRLEAGKLRVRPGLLSLRPFLEGIVRCEAAGAPEHKLHLRVEPGLPLAWADESHVNDVMFNLLDNAIKYSPPGSQVSVRASRFDANRILISVADEGPGVPPEEQARIFDKFYRGQGIEEQSTNGYGLGLYLAQKLVTAQGGQIWVDSQPGRGACFNFTLPVAAETADEAQGALN